MKKKFSPLFITFEGGEGSGKTTQAKLLDKYLRGQGFQVLLIFEPGGTRISNQIRNILLDAKNSNISSFTEVLLYIAARAQIVQEKIKPALEKGKIVICDRFLDSTLAYQGFARGIKIKEIIRINELATSGIKPDLTILLDLDPEIGFRRLQRKRAKIWDRLEKENIVFHQKVRQGYLNLAQKYPHRIKVFDGKKDINELHYQIINLIKGKI